jgi:prephenate dehydrogenase
VFKQLTIIGPGLLGASLGMAARHYGVVERVQAWARREEVRLACERANWCSLASRDLAEAVTGSDLVVVCLPVDRIVAKVEEMAPHLAPGAVVTDVGSTKSRICRHAGRLLTGETAFVGAHPMAGSEKSGLHHARVDLFRDRACLVTPLEESPPSAVEAVLRFWADIGMQVSTETPERHDEIVACISHLPHLLASVLAHQLSQRPEGWKALAGNGLRDTTRIASGQATIWRAIFEENREELLRAMDDFDEHFAAIRSALHNEDWLRLTQLLDKAKRYRDDLS